MLRKFFWQGVRTGILAFVQGLIDNDLDLERNKKRISHVLLYLFKKMITNTTTHEAVKVQHMLCFGICAKYVLTALVYLPN